jgi:hypothetical protein
VGLVPGLLSFPVAEAYKVHAVAMEEDALPVEMLVGEIFSEQPRNIVQISALIAVWKKNPRCPRWGTTGSQIAIVLCTAHFEFRASCGGLSR